MWNERYAKSGYLFGTEPAQFLLTHESYLIEGKTALAVADGEGRNSVFLAQKGMQVTAFDSSEVAIKKAIQLAATNQVTIDFQHSDFENWNWENKTYDVVIAIFIQFSPPKTRQQVFLDLQRSVSPGGILMLHGYTPKQIEFGTGGPRAIENLYTEKLLKSSFTQMEVLHINSYEKTIDEGQGHSGKSALIDFIAAKPK